jgi:uncharacterized protein YjbI with pentapeptide repeats
MNRIALAVAYLRISSVWAHLSKIGDVESELEPHDALTKLLLSMSPADKSHQSLHGQARHRLGSPLMRQGAPLTRGELMKRIGAGAGLAFTLAQLGDAPSAQADGDSVLKLPAINRNDKNRCKFVSSAMGQANAARDSLLDLRECKMAGQDASGADISGAFLADGDFSNVKFKESQLSKVYAVGANFDGADFTAAILDRGNYKKASFRGTIFDNAVLSGSSFDGADLENSDFSNTYIGEYEARKLCKNPTLKGENPKTGNPTAESAGCLR